MQQTSSGDRGELNTARPYSKMHFNSSKIHSPKAKLQLNAFEIADAMRCRQTNLISNSGGVCRLRLAWRKTKPPCRQKSELLN